MAVPNVVLFALTTEEKIYHLMRISRFVYSQNIPGFFILHKTELKFVVHCVVQFGGIIKYAMLIATMFQTIVLFNSMKLSNTQCL